jgi:glycosyltransferase involved in cell wall biosynthesis
MPTPGPKITVLVPIKNEEWILDRFLAVTSQFADHILIADQASTDRSPEICRRYPKVHYFLNPAKEFSELQRQRLLIDEARKVVAGPRLLLALDADEILAADAPGHPEWERMLEVTPGTIIELRKPDLVSMREAVDFDRTWPLGYMDDGAEHTGRVIHATRIPSPPGHPTLKLGALNVLHYNLLRPRALRSKRRRYCAIEHLERTNSFYRRTLTYRADIRWERTGNLVPAPRSWFDGWEKLGIDMTTVADSEFYPHDIEVLRLFAKHGPRFFQLDDIWDLDWEKCRQWALSQGARSAKGLLVCPPSRCRNKEG